MYAAFFALGDVCRAFGLYPYRRYSSRLQPEPKT